MAGIISVERLTITLGSGTASASANLTKSQTLANCVPFATHRVTTVASPVDDYSEYCIDVEMQSGPDRVTATTSEGTTRALVVEVTVVEFDPNRVTVQSGTYQMTAASSDTASITAVVLANTFLIHSWQIDGNTSVHNPAAVRGRFTSTTELTFDRQSAVSNVDGHWYVIESDSGDFSVEEFTVTLTAAASNTATISAVTMAKTFLVGSHTISDTTDDNADGSVEIVLTDTTTVTVQRAATGGNIVYTGYAIEFAAGGNESVQRGQIAAQGSTASQNVDITAVDLDVAMVQAAGSPQSWKNGSFPGSGSSDNADAFCGWDFVDLDTIRVQHSTNGGEASNDLAWEVIVWEILEAIERSVTDNLQIKDRGGFPLTGVTKDNAGATLGNCEVALFKQDGAAPPNYEFKEKGTSDASGNYSFVVEDQDALYMVYAIKPGSPNVMDASDNELIGDAFG